MQVLIFLSFTISNTKLTILLVEKYLELKVGNMETEKKSYGLLQYLIFHTSFIPNMSLTLKFCKTVDNR